MNGTTVSYSKTQIWILASRPKTLFAAITPVLIGCALAIADHQFHAPSFIAALLGAVFIQIGTNFANDLFDFKKKTDNEERLGPMRVTHAGLVTPAVMRNATIITFALAFSLGIYLVTRGGLPIVIIGLASILFGILYTGGPFPLGYNGLGELFVLVFFGPVAVAGTYYVMTLNCNLEVILAGIPPGMFSTAILVVNNLRDIDSDRNSGKKTLAARFGKTFAKSEYIAMLLGAMIYPAIHNLIFHSHPLAKISLATLILAAILIRQVLNYTDPRTLNDTLAGTGRLLFIYGLLFSIGWLL